MIIPYLSFQGNCEEAVKLYIAAFGGQIDYLSRYTVETGGEAMCGKVMHMELTLSGTHMACADSIEPVAKQDAIKLMVHYDTAAEANRAFELLAKGGVPIQRLTPHPPPDDGGMGALVKDPFGYTWILTAPNDQ